MERLRWKGTVGFMLSVILILTGWALFTEQSWAEEGSGTQPPAQEPAAEEPTVQYTLTVEFVDIFGKEIQSPHVETFDEGDELTVEAPDIDGYEITGEDTVELVLDGDKTVRFVYDEIPETGSGTINRDGVEIDPGDPSFLLKKEKKKKSKTVKVTKKNKSSGSSGSSSSEGVAPSEGSSGYVAYDDSAAPEPVPSETAEGTSEKSERDEKAEKPEAEEPAADPGTSEDKVIPDEQTPKAENAESHTWYWIIPILLIAAGILWWIFGKRRKREDSE